MVVNFTELRKTDERNLFGWEKQELSFGPGYFDFQMEILSGHLEIWVEIKFGDKHFYDFNRDGI